jgi:hypothetical protein
MLNSVSAASLPEAKAKLVAKKFLFEPHFREPGRGQRLDVAGRHQIADMLATEAAAVDLKAVRMKR